MMKNMKKLFCFALAVVMLFDPSLMNDLGTSAAIFITAFSVAGVILIVHRRILPQLGIWIGSEAHEKKVDEQTQLNEGEK